MENSTTKIQGLKELAATCEALRAQGKRISHCHGVFDLLHIGHIKHFEAAKRLGDVLVVTLTADQFVNKGTGRPAFSEDLRAEAIAALSVVDYVAINTSASAIDALAATKPSRYVKGADYKDRVPTSGSKMQGEVDLVRSFGGEIAFTEEPQFSSSKLLNEFLPPYTPLVRKKLAEARLQISSQEIQDFFVDLEKITGTVKVPRETSPLLSQLFPGVTQQPGEESSLIQEVSIPSERSAYSLHVGLTGITVQNAMTKKSFSIPLLSDSACDPALLEAVAGILSHHSSANVHLQAVFLAVFSQEARPGVTLAALRKVTESVLK